MLADYYFSHNGLLWETLRIKQKDTRVEVIYQYVNILDTRKEFFSKTISIKKLQYCIMYLKTVRC